MSPGETAHAAVLPPPPPDDAVPDYVQVLELAASYLPAPQLQLLRRAWAVGAAAHAGQSRKSGEPYITHPVAVASLLAEQKVDVETLIAAILHDTIEDTPLACTDACLLPDGSLLYSAAAERSPNVYDDGEVVGVVFLEDVIEELVGEVTDSSHGDRWTRRRV